MFTISDFINRLGSVSDRVAYAVARWRHANSVARATIIRIPAPLESHRRPFKPTDGGNTKSSIFDLH